MLPVSSTSAETVPSGKLLVGYWHNFDNGTGIINLRDVSSKWDVLNVSFGETGGDRSTIVFSPCYGTEASFKADIDYLHSKGKKVVLSIGGQNGVLLLPDETSKQNFIKSTEALIDKYGFDGIDIDLESGMTLIGGDNDFKNPTTPQITNLISALHTLKTKYGSNFLLSMAPETAYVQGGYSAYGNIWGAYLPLIYGVRDILTYIHVQHYNAGSNAGMDGVNYTQGTADYEVAMADMLLHGFPIAGNTNNMFPSLREDQVMIGLPACAAAAPSGGYITPTEMKKALDYIMKGIPFGGKYKIANPNGYPGFKGLMTWSVNWDAKSNYEFSTNYRSYFDGLAPIENKLQGATLSNTAVNNGAYTLTGTVPANNTATSYKILEGTSTIASGNLVKGQASNQNVSFNVTGKAPGTYTYTIVVSDGTASLTSNKVSVIVEEPGVDQKLQAATLSATAVNNGAYTLTGTVPAKNTATSYKILEGTSTIASGNLVVGQTTSKDISFPVTGKAPGTYTYTIVVSDGTASATSNQVVVTVPEPTVGKVPAKPSISYDNWDHGANYNIVMNMWWGENGTSWKLYENGVLVSTKTLIANGSNGQTASVAFTGKAKGTYVYQAELVNAAGSTMSDKITYTCS
jgi:chitinase